MKMARILSVVLLCACLAAADQEEVEGGKCERIKLSQCQDLGYNWTAMPNLMGHRDQKEAQEVMEKYSSIITSECSVHARFLLCSAFAPLCSEQVSGSVSACRALCETVSEDCKDQLKVLAPDVALDCSAFPLRAVRRLCMRPPNASELEAEPQPPPRWPFYDQELREQDCPPNHVRVPTGECWPACGQPSRYSRAEKRTAELWMDTMAWFSLLSTSFALLTFCAEPSRYRYPERPAVWMAACHAVAAAAAAARARAGGDAGSAGCAAAGGALAAPCVAFFSVTYYCTLAADAWFANACVAWYLTAASEWSTEALERAAAYLHAVAWGWAGAWTAAALALRRVVADEATGACSVAPAAAAALVGVPRGALLAAATALALAACPGIARVRRALGARGAKRVGRLALRAAASGLLYLLLACAATAAQLVENRGAWTACLPLACGAASGAWGWSRKSAAVWRRALCPPRKAPCCTPALLRSHHPYQKRPLPVSRV
ncbi:frizzled-10-like [Battus philenor]|uniref:frizzled-10-like n=1 Tax=Battus philenor TaxID=42288 RepID=UPI0035D10338